MGPSPFSRVFSPREASPADIVEDYVSICGFTEVIVYSPFEMKVAAWKAGSLVFDHLKQNCVRLALKSSNPKMTNASPNDFSYEPVIFKSIGPNASLSIHNVMMCIGTTLRCWSGDDPNISRTATGRSSLEKTKGDRRAIGRSIANSPAMP